MIDYNRKRHRDDDRHAYESSKRSSDHESRRNSDHDSRPVNKNDKSYDASGWWWLLFLKPVLIANHFCHSPRAYSLNSRRDVMLHSLVNLNIVFLVIVFWSVSTITFSDAGKESTISWEWWFWWWRGRWSKKKILALAIWFVLKILPSTWILDGQKELENINESYEMPTDYGRVVSFENGKNSILYFTLGLKF